MPEPSSTSAEEARPSRATLLVIDDDPRNRSLLRAYLGQDYEVREASDAPTGLAALDAGPVDLVLLDVMMPGTSGLEVCRRIKARQGQELLPVILLTALGEQEDRNAGLEAGADDFLTKPVERRELLLRVAAFLRIRQQQGVILRQVGELVELSTLKDDLVSLIVHDLRNPLASVFGILHLVRENVSDPLLRSDVELALQSAVRLRDTLDDLLQVRLLEERRIPLERQPMSPRALVMEAIRGVAGAARDRDVVLKVAGGPEVVVAVDRKLMRRALENLLVNAIKYSPPHGQVEVAWRHSPEGLELSVSDRGEGIPAPVRERLFQKFGAINARESNQRRGFGLGLYQVRLVADAHGGWVRAGDREGGGTTFVLLVPLVVNAPAGQS